MQQTPPFTRLVVDRLVRGPTRVWWELEPAWQQVVGAWFQLQVGYTSLLGADDWLDVGPPLLDGYYAVDTRHRDTGNHNEQHYRIKMVLGSQVFFSAPAGGSGLLEARDLAIAREIIRKEHMRLGSGAGVSGFLLKRKHYGQPCTRCLDRQLDAPTDSACPRCQGTGIMPGYHPPAAIDCFEIGLRQSLPDLDTQATGTVRRDPLVKVRFLAPLQLGRQDVWVNQFTDERWVVEAIEHVAEIRGVPLIMSATARLAPTTDSVYRIPLLGTVLDENGYVTPGPGTGSVSVNHNYDTPDELRLVDAAGAPIQDAKILVYRRADWVAAMPSMPAPDKLRAASYTLADGRWAYPVLLDPGQYTILFEKCGQLVCACQIL